MAPSVMESAYQMDPALPRTLLCPSDIETSIGAYETLLQTAKEYRNQLALLSQSANAFGAALEVCSRTKGVDEAAESLSTVAGLQFLIANHQSVLSDTVYRSFEIPLRESLENFVTETMQKREQYENELVKKKKLLAKREKEHMALAHKKQRSLVKFREALADLTKLADDIDKLKSDYFYNALDYHSDTWTRVGSRSKIICKAELSLYSGIASKTEHLDSNLVGTPDPWTQDPRSGDEMFHIVPPQTILARPQSPSHENGTGYLFQSLLGNVGSSTKASQSNHTVVDSCIRQEIASKLFGTDHERILEPVNSCTDTSTKWYQTSTKMDPVSDTFSMLDERKEALQPWSADPASPYQDAEEISEGLAPQDRPSEGRCAAQSQILTDTDASFLDTPSRPASKRSDMSNTPQKRPGMIIHDPITPRSRSQSGIVTIEKNKIECETEDLHQDTTRSPESVHAGKHSEYSPFTPCKIELEPREDE